MGSTDTDWSSNLVSTAMVVTDLDGTLLHRDGTISRTDHTTLKKLGLQNILRVIATGRSLFSACRVLKDEMPIDFLIFASGAGIVEWCTQKIIKKHTMCSTEVGLAARYLLREGFDFMIHEPIPNNHYFSYYGTGEGNPDFIRRIEYYREFSTRGNPGSSTFHDACQIVAIEPHNGRKSIYRCLKGELSFLNVVRTTSPMDGKSTWIELFPRGVTKAHAAEWLRMAGKIDSEKVLAVGNDYNDFDLLSWAPVRYIVDNAPKELKTQFQSVRSGWENGFSEAVEKWLELLMN